MDNDTIWNVINKYFQDTPQALVRHHIDSYNDFYKNGIYQIFKEKNPIILYSKLDPVTNEYMSQCKMYMGGKDGSKIYFGKPVIHDENNVHYMYPNEARLRNMNYSMTIHYDVEIEFIDKLLPGQVPTIIGGENTHDDADATEKHPTISDAVHSEQMTVQQEGEEGEGEEGEEQTGGAPKSTKIKKKKTEEVRLEMTTKTATQLRELNETAMSENTQTRTHVLEKIFLGRFPVMVQSDFCILHGLPKETRHTMGECRNDIGGYFIIDGKEKTIVAQEKFADNMLYIKKVDDEKYLYSAEIRSVSENVSKPVRTFSVKICTPGSKYTNKQIVVNIPNVRSPVPLFIVFRALGIISDKDIISYCLLDLDKYAPYMDLFIPSVHDASNIMTQQTALKYIALLTKGKGTVHALEILNDYFLPHIGETNYIAKAYALGDIVFRLLSVYSGIEKPTDRDNFKFKRIELVGSLLYDLFREYWNIQLKNVNLEFEKRLYYDQEMYENDLFGLITNNYKEVFRERDLEKGFKKAYKGNWGSQTHTKRVGAVQDLNRLSFNSAMNHLRKTNLPLDSSVKLVGPRVLHNSQWGFIDPIDTPDGGSIGLHKHLAISTYITRGVSREPMIAWLREKWAMKLIEEFVPLGLSKSTKVYINGFMVGAVDKPIQCVETFRLYRRNALLPIYSSAAFDIRLNTIFVYTDAGRLCRPIFYKDEHSKKMSYQSKTVLKTLQDNDFSWEELITGFNKKRESVNFDPSEMKIYNLHELYEGVENETNPAKLDRFLKNKGILDFIDNSESEHALIAFDTDSYEETSSDSVDTKYTHCEIHNSLMFGMMCNMIIFPENNPATRNSFSCGQSKQACSMYHTNYQVRMDKTAVLLNYGQTPLVKSRYLDHITHEENPYGENAIVAIACFTGYNVEDAILVNEASIKRGLFRTSYISCYESHEESTKNMDTVTDIKFTNIQENPNVVGTRSGSDYSQLDENGMIKTGTIVTEDTALIGRVVVNYPLGDNAINQDAVNSDDSKFPKKGQTGVVERVFITDDEEGKRIAKVRIIDQRIPTLGDKMASRAGQKGTIGMVVPERDMPFTADGIRPDLIINPHALPTRMTIGQLVECITGKACAMMGGFGDCTAFNNKGSKIGVFGEILTKQGFHSNGNEILYDGMSGKQMESEIFMGPTYYMRLKHMVKDKVNSRRKGPRTKLTKQAVGGRANDGGLRIGEMERDTLISHGITDFLTESMMDRGDRYYLAVCNHSGMISIYNPNKKLFMSPMADGPLKYAGSLENEDMRLEHVTQFGRSFSVISIPYSFKLLVQELQAVNIQMRIITEDNIDQIENMSYSNNIEKVTNGKIKSSESLITSIQQLLKEKLRDRINTPDENDFTPNSQDTPVYNPNSPGSSVYNPNSPGSPAYDPNSPPYSAILGRVMTEQEFYAQGSPPYAPGTPPYPPGSPQYATGSPAYSQPWAPGSLGTSSDSAGHTSDESTTPIFIPQSPDYPPPQSPDYPPPQSPDYPPPGNSPQEGGGSRYNIGERVCMRNCKDNYPTRPWRVSHVGPKFLTVSAIDNRGLSENEATNVVLPFDIFPETQAQSYAPTANNGMNTQFDNQPAMSLPNNQPTVVIAPKFFNGNGSDNSMTDAPTSVEPMSYDNLNQQPSIVVKDSIVKQTTKAPEKSRDAEPDFSNLVIKKVG
jgi:DNA-directed RNA polymerase II subunit RPB2